MANHATAELAAYIQEHPPCSGDTVADSDVTVDDRQGNGQNVATNIPQSSAPELQMKGTGLGVLGKDVKTLIQGIQELRHLGVEGLVDPLPKIAVVGDQSTGKSSLIEGISEIKVPRSAGCCTRCPLEINTSEGSHSDELWLCEVSIVKKYLYEGSKTAKLAGATKKRLLGPWSAQEIEIFHFATVNCKEDVEDTLFRAQLAVLNPGMPIESFMPGLSLNDTAPMQVKFSPNLVRLDIVGVGLPNLAFYDLPGVINVAEVEEERYLVTLVRNLVFEYIRGEDCINLLTLPLTNDAANSSAARLIKEAGVQERTIGVLTKPDRLQSEESFEQWKEILRGERFRLGNNYHVVKNNPDPTVDHATARLEEEDFFATQEPWATTLSMHHDRFGTKRLQNVLSSILANQISKSLPRIVQQVSQKTLSIEAELATLPKPLAGNLPAVLMRELTSFTYELEKHMDGGSAQFPFQKNWMNLAKQFRAILEDSRPVMIRRDASEPQMRIRTQPGHASRANDTPTPRGPLHQSISLDSEDDEKVCTPTHQSNKRTSAPSSHVSPTQKRPKITDIPQFGGEKALAKSFTLSEIRNIIQDAFVAGIPNQVHPKAVETMCTQSIRHWEKPLNEFLRQTSDIIKGVFAELLDKVFLHRKGTKLYAEIISVINDFISKAMEDQHLAAQRMLRLEIAKPMTLNREALASSSATSLTLLEDARSELRSLMYLEEQDRKIPRTPNTQSKHDRAARVSEAQLGVDPFAQEIQVMATVRGYYSCAFSRFVDVICQGIQGELFLTCRNGIFGELQDKLGILENDANERCAILMAQDPEVEIRRSQLKKEKATLVQAQARLDRLFQLSPDTDALRSTNS